MLSPIIFFAIIILLAVAIHVYLWLRLVRSTTRPGKWRRIGTITLTALGLITTVAFMVTRTVGVDAWWLAWPGYLWMALLFYLVLGLVVLEVPRAVYALWRRRRAVPRTPATTLPREPASPDPDRSPLDPSRRLFIARACAATACVAAGGMVGYGLSSAFGDLTTTRAAIPLKGLDARLSGFRIAVVSDTHFGPFLDQDLAERIVTLISGERPDMVAIIGDLADGSVAETGHAAEPLRRLASRHGTYFVTGNHDYSSGVDEWLDLVREMGIRPLLNESVEISARGAAFDLAGVNDLFARMYSKPGPDFSAALKDRDPGRPVVLLAHQPVQVHTAIEHGVDLQLSGHTHGGQTAPFDRLVGLQQPVVSGLARKGPTSIFVTSGAGFFGPPVRAGIPPEVAIVELQSLG